MAVKKQKVNWNFQGKDFTDISQFPDGIIGFVYKLTFSDSTYYVGCKQIISIRGTQSNWKSYNGSSKPILDALKSGEIKITEKEILEFAISKQELLYRETLRIICDRVLEDEQSRNGWVSCKLYKSHIMNPKPMKITTKRKTKKKL